MLCEFLNVGVVGSQLQDEVIHVEYSLKMIGTTVATQ